MFKRARNASQDCQMYKTYVIKSYINYLYLSTKKDIIYLHI